MPSDTPPQGGGLGATLKSKWGPLPVWGWLAIITVVAVGFYLYSKHKAGSQGTTANGPGAVGQPGVVVINQDEPGTGGGGGDDDDGGKKKPPKPPEGTTRSITVDKNETLGQLAKSRHWSQATLKQVEEMNLTQGQGEWTPSTRLKKGDTVIRPLRG